MGRGVQQRSDALLVCSKSSLRTSSAQSGLTVNILVLCAGALCLSRQLLVAYLCLPLLSEVHSLLMRIRAVAVRRCLI